jgi:hypothetical protein|tara:strand:- start:622 stop:735 length:114 start_codon:yes stop_codon:yes gene_type:complete
MIIYGKTPGDWWHTAKQNKKAVIISVIVIVAILALIF